MSLVLFRTNPAFRALGRGYYNKLPDFPATKGNGNALFHNRGLNEGNRNHKLWLFCTQVETGWAVAGDTAQTALSRTFYPRNLSQTPLTITGMVANQFEYDRLVEFVTAHQRRAVDPMSTDNIGTKPVRFSLRPYKVKTGVDRRGNPTYRYIHQGMMLEGYVMGVQAGAERFQNARTWQVEFRVSNDFLDPAVHTQAAMDQVLKQAYIKQLISKRIKGSVDVKDTSTTTITGSPNDLDFWGNLPTNTPPPSAGTIFS